jgi:hypothetical protein
MQLKKPCQMIFTGLSYLGYNMVSKSPCWPKKFQNPEKSFESQNPATPTISVKKSPFSSIYSSSSGFNRRITFSTVSM